MSILCKLGLHNWTNWTVVETLVEMTTFLVHKSGPLRGYLHTRECKRCKAFQSKLTTS